MIRKMLLMLEDIAKKNIYKKRDGFSGKSLKKVGKYKLLLFQQQTMANLFELKRCHFFIAEIEKFKAVQGGGGTEGYFAKGGGFLHL